MMQTIQAISPNQHENNYCIVIGRRSNKYEVGSFVFKLRKQLQQDYIYNYEARMFFEQNYSRFALIITIIRPIRLPFQLRLQNSLLIRMQLEIFDH